MRNNVLIILSILVLVVGQISEETASQRTQITLSFGQANNFIKEGGVFFSMAFHQMRYQTNINLISL